MRSIILFVDGGQKKAKAKQWVTGFGVRAHFKGASLEIKGAYPVNYNSSQVDSKQEQSLLGQHEIIAFVEGMLFARSHGYVASEMVFYTDDEVVAYGGQWLADVSSWQRYRVQQLETRIRSVCEALYSEEIYCQAIECLKIARFHKVKGHDCCVDNERVDYLVKQALDEAIGDVCKVTKSYSEWLTEGLVRYRPNGEVRVWTPPFIPVPELPATVTALQ